MSRYCIRRFYWYIELYDIDIFVIKFFYIILLIKNKKKLKWLNIIINKNNIYTYHINKLLLR